MAEIEQKVIDRLDKLASVTDGGRSTAWASTALIVFLAALGFLVFFTSTKPSDVLRATGDISVSVARLELEVLQLNRQVTELNARLDGAYHLLGVGHEQEGE